MGAIGKCKNSYHQELSVIVVNNFIHPLKIMESFVQTWIANDDNKVEGVWADWYTDQVEIIRKKFLSKF